MPGDLNPRTIRAEMARRCLSPIQVQPYEDPDRGWVVPLDEAQAEVREFLGWLWRSCLAAEVPDAG